MNEAATETRLRTIIEAISADNERLRQGDAAELSPVEIADLVDEAVSIAGDIRPRGITDLNQDDAARAAATLPLWQATIAQMDRARLRQLVHDARRAGDRVLLHLIGVSTNDAEIQHLAAAPLVEVTPLVSAVRAAGATWRDLSRRTPEQRQKAAAIQERIAAARAEREREQEQGERPRPASVYGGFL